MWIVWNLEPLASGGQSGPRLIPHVICQVLYAWEKNWARTYSIGDQVPTCAVFTRAKIKSRYGILVDLPSQNILIKKFFKDYNHSLLKKIMEGWNEEKWLILEPNGQFCPKKLKLKMFSFLHDKSNFVNQHFKCFQNPNTHMFSILWLFLYQIWNYFFVLYETFDKWTKSTLLVK